MLTECFLAVAHFFWQRLEPYTPSYYFIHTRLWELLVPKGPMVFRPNTIFFPYHFIFTHMHAVMSLNYKTCLFFRPFSETVPRIICTYNLFAEHSKLRSTAYSWSITLLLLNILSPATSWKVLNCSDIVAVVCIHPLCTFCRYFTTSVWFFFLSVLLLCHIPSLLVG